VSVCVPAFTNEAKLKLYRYSKSGHRIVFQRSCTNILWSEFKRKNFGFEHDNTAVFVYSQVSSLNLLTGLSTYRFGFIRPSIIVKSSV